MKRTVISPKAIKTACVPRATASDENKYLKADGTWDIPNGAKPFVVQLDDVSNSSGSYTHTTTLSGVTATMKPIQLEVSDASVFLNKVTVSCSDGEVTLSCSNVVGTSSVYVTLMEQGSVPSGGQMITSEEFDILNNRIGALNALSTTEKTSIVGAINEVYADMGAEKLVLLWENPDPTADFPAGDINIDMTEYDGIAIALVQAAPLTRAYFSDPRQFGYVFATTMQNVDGNSFFVSSRKFVISSTLTKLTADIGKYVYRDGGNGTGNNHAVPYRIFGIKTVR